MDNFADSFYGVALGFLITLIVAMIGLIGVIYQTKKDLMNNITFQRSSIVLNENLKIMETISELFDGIFLPQISKMDDSERLERMITLRKWVYAYGSNDAINILSMMFNGFYNDGNLNEEERFLIVALYPLLSAQVRYDLTGEVASPEKWLEMRITDFENNKERFKKANNHLVDKLRLNRKLKIK